MVVAACVVAAFIGCSAGIGPGSIGTDGSKGAVTIGLAALGARSITPPITPTCASYIISGTGPSGASAPAQTVTGNSVTFNALNPGTWSFTVIGYSNALPTAGIAIAAGSGVTSVSPGTTSNLNISVVEYSGSGTLAVTAQWPTTPAITNQSLTANLINYSGTTIQQTFGPITSGAGNFSATATNNLPAGWYVDQVILNDGNGNNSGGLAFAARVAQGQTSAGTVAISPTPGAGQVIVGLNPVTNDPINLAGTPAGGTVVTSKTPPTFSVSGTTAGGVPAVFFEWFINGAQVATGGSNSYTPPTAAWNALLIGTPYRVDVVAFSASGSNAGDCTWGLVNADPIQDTISVNGHGLPNEVLAVTVWTDPNSYPSGVAWPAIANWYNVTCDGSGHFTVTTPDLPPGHYYVSCYNQANTFQSWYSASGGTDLPHATTITLPYTGGAVWNGVVVTQ
jgi:hypothetical protein